MKCFSVLITTFLSSSLVVVVASLTLPLPRKVKVAKKNGGSSITTTNGSGGGGSLDLSAVLPPPTCGSCYGGWAPINDNNLECCKTCKDVVQAYKAMQYFPPPRLDRITQCNNSTSPHPKDEGYCCSCYLGGEASCCNTCDDVKQAWNGFSTRAWPPVVLGEGEHAGEQVAVVQCDLTAVPTTSPVVPPPSFPSEDA